MQKRKSKKSSSKSEEPEPKVRKMYLGLNVDMNNEEAKKEYWHELDSIEKTRIKEAQRRLFLRFDEIAADKASKWIFNYRMTVLEGDTE